ncbi:MAG TPA: type II CAAX endopeptidase family protein [Bryobacteraceae bacterium]|nr:type II CAAX endopeptidase family protein [Bryobacteraceae bacterium]
MQTAILVLLAAAILAWLCSSVRRRAQATLRAAPLLVWGAPAILTALFCGVAIASGAFRAQLALTVAIYLAAPTLCVAVQGTGSAARPGFLDFLAIVLLWLPLEFAAGAPLVPRASQGFLHSVTYGIAILLALVLFLGFRAFPGLKYNLPRAARDYWLPLAAFAVLAPVLAMLGYLIGFIPLPHVPTQAGGRMGAAVVVVFLGTALPEEILFRSLIQNLLMLRFGTGTRMLLLASLIFGCAHLDNGPQALPNWRYMILATIAGVAYGKVFQKASTVLSSAGLHMLVDWTKHFFF